MPLTQRQAPQLTSSWRAFGHSYLQYAFGTADQTGRIDGQFSAAMDVERGANWQNYSVNGAQLLKDGYAQGGYVRVLQTVKPNIGRGGPYAPDGGATLFCYGINDLGFNGGGTSQVRTAFQHALRAVISRVRASTIFDDDFQVGTRTSYSAGFTSLGFAQDQASGATERISTAGTTGHTITMTLPADYNGEPIAIAFVGVNGATSGGTLTFSGTAGVTGTLVTTNIAPSGTHTHMIKRVTGLTSANAGQTIIATVTAVGGGSASVEYDGWWLEAKNAPPVIICNVARLTATGYTSNYAGWSGTEASRDTDVQNLNGDIATVVAEFDSMVQVADLDSVLNKGVGPDGQSLFFDGLHPNELGAARCVDQIITAYRRMSQTTALGTTANFNPPAPRWAGTKQPRISGRYYTWCKGANPTAVIPSTTVGNLWAFPFVVCGPRERYNLIAMRTGPTAGGTAGQFRWGLYDDPGWTGYPQCLYSEPTVGAAKSTGTAASANITDTVAWPLDPGLYWIAFKWTVLPLSPRDINIAPAVADMWDIMPDLDSTTTLHSANPVCCWEVTGQGTGVFPGFFPAGAALGTVTTAAAGCKPHIALRLA